jgi:hypothetical protein
MAKAESSFRNFVILQVYNSDGGQNAKNNFTQFAAGFGSMIYLANPLEMALLW